MSRPFLGALAEEARELKQKSSLPDIRHQIALYLMKMLI